MVGHHQAQRQGGDHHHAGGGTQTTQKGQQGSAGMAFKHGQGQYVQIGRDALRTKQGVAKTCQRQYGQRNEDEIEREQPAPGAHLVGIATFGDRNMKLVRHGKHGQRPQQNQRGKAAGVGGDIAGGGQINLKPSRQHQGGNDQHGNQLEG